MADREQARRDALNDTNSYTKATLARIGLDLLAELKQAERKQAQAEQMLRETAVRLGQAERERDEWERKYNALLDNGGVLPG